MARDLRSSNVIDLEGRDGATGRELVPTELDGRDVQLTAQQIANLAPSGGTTITASVSDPGATGAGSGWLLLDASGASLAFFIRNNANDAWLADGSLPLGALDVTVELADDLEVGEASGTFARLLVTPLAVGAGFVTLFQSKFEGDTYPRIVITSDGSIFIGDGTANPLQGNAQGLFPQGSGMQFSGAGSSVIIQNTGAMNIDAVTNLLSLSAGSMVVNSGGNIGIDMVTLGFFDKAPAGSAQKAYINPASITPAQIGQILIDFGWMAAS